MLHGICAALIWALFSTASGQPLPEQATLPTNIESHEAEFAYERFLVENNWRPRPEFLVALQNFVQTWPNHAGAVLDLALLHCELGDWESMNEQFESVQRRFRLPDGIRDFIKAQREKVCDDRDTPEPPVTRDKWLWEVLAGYSNNANYATDLKQVRFTADAPLASLDLAPNNRRRSDSYLAFKTQRGGVLSNGVQWTAALAHRKHDLMSSLDQSGLKVGLWKPLESSSSQSDKVFQEAGSASVESGVGVGFEQWWVNARPQASAVRFTVENWLHTRPWGLGNFGFVGSISLFGFPENHLFDAQRLDLGFRLFREVSGEAWAYCGIDGFWDIPSHDRPGGRRNGLLGLCSVNLRNDLGRIDMSAQLQLQQENDFYNRSFFGEVRRRRVTQHLVLTQIFGEHLSGGLRLLGTNARIFVGLDIEVAKDRIEVFSFSAKTLRFGLTGMY